VPRLFVTFYCRSNGHLNCNGHRNNAHFSREHCHYDFHWNCNPEPASWQIRDWLL